MPEDTAAPMPHVTALLDYLPAAGLPELLEYVVRRAREHGLTPCDVPRITVSIRFEGGQRALSNFGTFSDALFRVGVLCGSTADFRPEYVTFFEQR